VAAGALQIDGGSISSSAGEGSAGASGGLFVDVAGDTFIVGAGAIETSSANANAAGLVALRTANLRVDGEGSRISSSNSSHTGDAGTITIQQTAPGMANGILLNEGGLIATSAIGGAAGDIVLGMAPGTLLG
jgi:hypothetical protein